MLGFQADSVDGVLCFYTHDIMNSPRALRQAVQALRRGGRFVAAGGKRVPGLRGLMLNPIILAYSLPFITNLAEVARPWKHLEALLGPLVVEEHLWGSAYVAYSVKRVMDA
jgi:SAM-dependent methyltransferase